MGHPNGRGDRQRMDVEFAKAADPVKVVGRDAKGQKDGDLPAAKDACEDRPLAS